MNRGIAIYGAGAVGLVLGARLARSGSDVLFVTRREEAAQRIRERGVSFEDPASGERWRTPAAAICGPTAEICERIVLFCVRTADTAPAAFALADAAPGTMVASFQNDVDNEAALAEHFPGVIGAAVRQTCTRNADDAALATGAGRIVLGEHPTGAGAACQELAQRLRRAGYDVGISNRISEDKWLKLVINLMSAPNALVRREDHATRAFVETKARLLEEGSDALAAAGVVARSCDGRDRSLADEIRYQRGSLAAGTSARDLPIYNQVWSALRHGGPLEADDYHRRVIALADRYGIDAPQNRRVLEALERAQAESLGPESATAESLLVD